MTRDEAIAHIMNLSQRVAGEFCCSTEEEDALRQQTREALAALGVDI